MPRAKRQPLRAVRNGVQAKAEEAPKPVVSVALKKAIDTMDDTRLRMWVKHYCESNELLRKELEKSLLVPGKDIVRYHADSDSEDKEMENGDEEEKEEKNKRPIVIDDEETTSRFAKCDHCGEEFDITENEKGDCIWHPGEKKVDDDASIWDDLEEHWGHPRDYEDDSEFADGFMWTCCEERGDHEGCKSTKHKADTNVIEQKPAAPAPTKPSRKRKAEMEIRRPMYAQCENCHERFDIKDNKEESCVYHPGEREADYESEHWIEWEEERDGKISSLVDDPDHAEGFIWSCCEGAGDELGCVEGVHEA